MLFCLTDNSSLKRYTYTALYINYTLHRERYSSQNRINNLNSRFVYFEVVSSNFNDLSSDRSGAINQTQIHQSDPHSQPGDHYFILFCSHQQTRAIVSRH